jgi:ribonuclease III
MQEFKKLAKSWACKFKDYNLLKQALVHRSFLNENPNFEIGHNERLEFLGDAVLEIIVTEHLYFKFPNTSEGNLTNWRASLVNSKMLHKVAEELLIDDYLYLSKGESKDKDKKSRQFILANAVEAIIGAIYLDQGIKEAKKFIEKYILIKLQEILDSQTYLDPKSKFQEKAQEQKGITPHYEILEEKGPDHDKNFKVGLYLKEDMISTGNGSSKQEAQVSAATAGLKKFNW